MFVDLTENYLEKYINMYDVKLFERIITQNAKKFCQRLALLRAKLKCIQRMFSYEHARR